jgi:hypothetical protein
MLSALVWFRLHGTRGALHSASRSIERRTATVNVTDGKSRRSSTSCHSGRGFVVSDRTWPPRFYRKERNGRMTRGLILRAAIGGASKDEFHEIRINPTLRVWPARQRASRTSWPLEFSGNSPSSPFQPLSCSEQPMRKQGLGNLLRRVPYKRRPRS